VRFGNVSDREGDSMGHLITKIDWNTFCYLFSPDPRTAFQQLAEQLFCFEFHQPFGIYRYYNQPYIETMPVHYDGACIGFQVKYYDASTNLSDRKGELIATITGAHNKYPDIDKIIFYINKEPGISTAKEKEKPLYINEIEAYGNTMGISVAWRGLNQIETMLLRPELESIREYFFATSGGIRQFLTQLELHTKSIFDSIESDISYGNQSIKISRRPFDFGAFLNSNHDVLLVHGESGCGKSGLIKDQLGMEKRFPVWLLRATDFNMPSLPEFARKFGDCSWADLLSAFDSAPHKICIIDSGEKAFTIEYQETFEAAVRLLRQHGWQLIITIRTSYRDTFLNTVLRTSNVSEHIVQKLEADEMSVLEMNNGLSMPTDTNLRDFLCNLFYLKLYLSGTDIAASKNVAEFLYNVWEQVICDSTRRTDSLNVRRGQTICGLVRSNNDRGTTYYVPCNEEDWEALASLVDDDIIKHDDTMGGYFLTHDVYEEIVLKHILTVGYNQKQNLEGFFLAIGDGLVMRKAFRLWLRDQFENANEGISDFLSDVLTDESCNPIWKDEILVSLMAADNSEYTSLLDGILKENGYKLYIRALVLLNTACKVVDDELLQQILNKEEIKTCNVFRFTKPSGLGWNYLIPYAYTHREHIPWSPIIIMLTADVLYAWTRHVQNGKTTRNVGLMALYLYQQVKNTEYHYRLGDKKIDRIIDAILSSAEEILPELTAIFETTIEKKATSHREPYTDLCEHLLSNTLNCGTMCAAAPELVFQLAKCFWLEHETSKEHRFHSPNISAYFGLRNHIEHEYYPESAFQTPTFALLQAAHVKAIDFIIELFDTVTEAYQNSSLNTDYTECSEMEIVFPNGDRSVQVVSNRLWLMYRGTSVAPNLLKSILMALERWLYFWIPEVPEDLANSVCVQLLFNSHSAAITAVVVSMVIAYPDKLFPIACILLHTKEIFRLDIVRQTKERETGFFKGLIPGNKLYNDERIRSNALPFRQKRLEDIILGYQLDGGTFAKEDHQMRLHKLYKAIDESFQQLEDLEDSKQFFLYRMDLRKLKLVCEQTEKDKQVALVPDLPENLILIQQKLREGTKNDDNYLKLFLWSQSRFNNETDQYQKYDKYETNPQSALTDVLSFLSDPCVFQIDESILIYVSAVLLINFEYQLDETSTQICAEVIVNYLRAVIEEQRTRSIGDGTDAAIAALLTLIAHRAMITLPDSPVVLLLMLICGWGKQRDWAVKDFRQKGWYVDQTLAQNILTAFILLKPGYDQKVSKHGGISPFKFIEANEALLNSILEQQEPGEFPDFSVLSETALQTLNLLLPTEISLTRIVLAETGKLFWSRLFEDRRHSFEERGFRDMDQEHAYLNWLAEYLLCTTEQGQNDVVAELAPYITISDMTDDLLTCIIMRQDQLVKPYAFWHLWDELFKIIEELCIKKKDALLRINKRDIDRYYGGELDKIVTTYLLAFPWWQDSVHSWHTLRKEDINFFIKAATRLGYHPGTLYSVARVLNTIGYDYLDYGIKWLATIIRGNPHLKDILLEVNTDYYIEEYVQRFITSKRTDIKRSPELRSETLDVLSFLVDRGSTCGFMLRESIC